MSLLKDYMVKQGISFEEFSERKREGSLPHIRIKKWPDSGVAVWIDPEGSQSRAARIVRGWKE